MHEYSEKVCYSISAQHDVFSLHRLVVKLPSQSREKICRELQPGVKPVPVLLIRSNRQLMYVTGVKDRQPPRLTFANR